MQKYTGFYICPYCEEKFEWEYVDNGHRKWMNEFIAEPAEVTCKPYIAQCNISELRDGRKTLTGYCTHCQTPVEIKDTGDIPKELFS